MSANVIGSDAFHSAATMEAIVAGENAACFSCGRAFVSVKKGCDFSEGGKLCGFFGFFFFLRGRSRLPVSQFS